MNPKAILILLVTLTILHGGMTSAMNPQKPILPETVGVWTKPESPKRVNAETIFDYMNGAGELYVGYRFNHLEVFDYTSVDQHNILVELYYMESSDDAYGLLSLDWGGEPISSAGASARALYGAGFMRIWTDNVYARVLAYNETPASRQAVLSLGKAISTGRKNSLKPELVDMLSPRIGANWLLRNDRLSYIRSYLVLNSIFYLSGENILDLGLSTQAVIAPYDNQSGTEKPLRCQFLMIAYPNHARANRALSHFHAAYLPEYKQKAAGQGTTGIPDFFKLEDGWLAYQQVGKYILIVFESPDQESAGELIRGNGSNL